MLSQLDLQLLPVLSFKTRQPVDLLDEENVAWLCVGKQPEQLRAIKPRAALVLDVPRGDLQAALSGESLELIASAVGVLIVGGSSEIAPGRSGLCESAYVALIDSLVGQGSAHTVWLRDRTSRDQSVVNEH